MLVRKTHLSETEGLEYDLTTEHEDRYGDRVVPKGVDTTNFKRNPIALLNHDKNAPVGTWSNLRVQDGALRGRLVLAPEGTSPRIDEIRKLVTAGILKGVSIGFLPVESEPIIKTGGTRYIRSELVECSLVAIPANPHALQVSKMLGVSKETLNMVFKRNSNAAISGRSRLITDNRATISQRIAWAKAKAKAEAVLENSKAREVSDRSEKARAAQLKNSKEYQARHSLGITWRGQKIPDGWFYEGYRKHWGDRES